MTLKHSTFLFNYQEFQETIMPLTHALNSGNTAPLQKRVAQIRQEIKVEENWMLHDKGTYLTDDAGLLSDTRYQNALWGNWFLIVLSTFLQPITSFDYDWSKLSVTLHSMGWDVTDVELVTKGLPIVWLLKPEATYQHGMRIEWTLPYWYWIRPMRCSYCGWLPIEEVIRLHKLLQSKQDLFEAYVPDFIQLPANVSATNAYISRELDPNYWHTRIPLVYNQAIQVMEYAVNNKQGLFTVIYQEYGKFEES